ncbi:MAG: DUF169 domain-containing protein [Actinomycetota bacterium]
MEYWHELGITIERHLRVSTFPVAVRFLEKGEEAPDKARLPVEVAGEPMALCQGITFTRRRGLTMCFDRDQSTCPLAISALGWDDGEGLEFLPAFLVAMNYARDQRSARRKAERMARLERERYDRVVLSPLARTRVEPHLVMVFGNPAQVMRLVQAVSRWTGERVAAGFGGIGGSCNEGLVRTFLEEEPRVALPGNGDRVFAATQDDELLFCFPASWAEKVVEGLQATSERGIRYPIPTFLNYRLPFPDLMARFGNAGQEG